MISEYEIVKAMKTIVGAMHESKLCKNCRIKQYCGQGIDANLCWGIETNVNGWTAIDWEQELQDAKERDAKRKEERNDEQKDD